ncbi:MAG: hypothetical protein IJ928_00870 [Prevotella sp.]|nr:hypothetical protein [Prevotella sp.]
MVAGDIISNIIKRMKFWGRRFPNATTSFIPNTKNNSFYYLFQNRGDNYPSVQIRLSNHGTYIETWTDREELGNSVERIDPARSINISIVLKVLLMIVKAKQVVKVVHCLSVNHKLLQGKMK